MLNLFNDTVLEISCLEESKKKNVKSICDLLLVDVIATDVTFKKD